MRQIIIKNLDRESFNRLVAEYEAKILAFGFKKPDALIEYEYIDENDTIIRLICNDSKRTDKDA